MLWDLLCCQVLAGDYRGRARMDSALLRYSRAPEEGRNSAYGHSFRSLHDPS